MAQCKTKQTGTICFLFGHPASYIAADERDQHVKQCGIPNQKHAHGKRAQK